MVAHIMRLNLCLWLSASLGLLVSGMPARAAGEPPVPTTLNQGWSPDLRELYYYTPQGSRLMPYRWFVALERADSPTPFASPANMRRYGFVASLQPGHPRNPDHLPVGFVVDPVDLPGTGTSVGLSCAACHTNDVTAGKVTIRIDGAPALANFDLFVRELSDAVLAAAPNPLAAANPHVQQPTKFLRLAAKVLGPSATPATIAEFGKIYAATTTTILGDLANRTPAVPGGPGRVDALTEIINALSVIDLKQPSNLRNPLAPVSYPHLWLAPRLDWVQWNPVASSPIARNVGEVMGVFGHANLTAATQADGRWQSTARVKELMAMEDWLRDLMPPAWPEKLLGTIDKAKAAKGKALFARDCRACHNMPPFDLTDKAQNIVGKQFIKIGAIDFREIGTDPRYNLALLNRIVLTEGLSDVFSGRPVAAAAEYFLGTVGKIVVRAMNDAGLTPEQQLAANDFRFYPPTKDKPQPEPWSPSSVTALKAGPLFGVWATGPYLHNGSVPNIYELLLPPEKRSKRFWVGSRELDTRKLGFKSTEQDLPPAQRAGLFLFDTSLPGNSNAGHVYPARGYSESERYAVIEFLKSAVLDKKDLPQ